MSVIDRAEAWKPLGLQRNRLLVCLGADLPAPCGPFAEEPADDPFAAYRGFVERLSVQWAPATDRVTVSLLAAARLLYGDLSAARIVVDHLPSRPIRTDHDAADCLFAPLYAFCHALPLPEHLRDISEWLDGSLHHAALRHWLDE